jgi:FecR protein
MKNRVPHAARPALFVFAFLIGTAAGAQTHTSQPTSPVAGKVKLVHGEVTIVESGGVQRQAGLGMNLYPGDLVATGPNAELHAEMEDGAYLAARPNTQIKLVAYQMTGTAADRSWIDLLKGGLRMVTGWIGKTNPNAYRLKTPVATIGIRGTDFEVQHFSAFDAPSAAEAGTQHLVHEGATLLSTEEDDVEVPAGSAAYATDAQHAPKLHTDVPEFFKRKRGQFDTQVDEKAANIKATILAKLQEKALATTGETLAERIERFRQENPESTLTNRELIDRAARRAARQGSGGRSGGRR